MAINWKSPADWRSRNRGIMTDYDGIVFSLAWKENGIWQTFYRKFHLQNKGKVLNGQYTSKLHFKEKLKLNEDNFIMIYGVPKDINYKTIKRNFEEQNLGFLIFKEIFIISEEDIKFYLPNLNIKTNWSLRLKGLANKKNVLQIDMEKSTYFGDEYSLKITLPRFSFDIKYICDFCLITKDKYD